MPTRLVRTDTIANLVDFGAVPDNPGAAALASACRPWMTPEPK